ncbi:RHS repeat-associated core domain-containing protein, partial [Pseudomonas sp. ANT_H14]|uniref:RHS repeat-associated core domain-containing protein n=1 Tax=unclassified Pseudomonas TaxID=196821 RepID=UPI0011EC8209
YRAYGQIAKLDVNTVNNPLRFQGQYFDQESGLHYNRHRYYNPDNGRYLTTDPVKLAGGLNGYQYVPNPTGWVDPLGLSTCPGGDGCKPATKVQSPAGKATIDPGEPSTPQPGVTVRQAKIEELTEKNAKRRITEFEGKYGMHMVTKHGPEVPHAALVQRAIDGTDPITGYTPPKSKGNPSSQFTSWKMQLNAWIEATTRTDRGMTRYTGLDDKKNHIVRIEQPGAGRGYRPNKNDKQNPVFNNSMNGAEMKFRQDGTPFTLFPIEGK